LGVILFKGNSLLGLLEKATIESRSAEPREEITRRMARFSICNLAPVMLALTSRTVIKSMGARREGSKRDAVEFELLRVVSDGNGGGAFTLRATA
jgi:hypothetical protein